MPASFRPLAALCLAISFGVFAVPLAKAQEKEASRIVAIGGAITETLYALGVQDRIVAVDTTAVYPPEAKRKPNVGYMRALSAEGVLAQSPDLVLMEEGAGPPPAIALLKASGIAITTIPDGHGQKAIGDKIEKIGGAVGKAEEGRALAGALERDLAGLQKELVAIDRHKRVLFILSLVDGRPMAAGTQTAADTMMRLAGGVNVLSAVQGYKTLNAEAATALAPDVVVMITGAGPNHAMSDPLAIPALKATPAGRNGALITMDAAYLLGFGPRTADAARDLAAKLYPGEIAPSR
ncbi:ABC transporter substrate-binding protein [Jiella sp. KSK16Y-1]|uniref:ABC transporter substrate-binding protein n=2 Tax=Jiella mangrovi TaxID=2821407 RepID=A0ABS4BHL8_9HYPH|nr:ABC transporter substrate-binding protein [Jiella mangrovi]